MTDGQRKQAIRALLEERRGYENRGLTDRVALVDEQLRRLGADAAAPLKRATRRARP